MNGKLVAPVIVTMALVLVFFGYAALCALIPIPIFFKLVGLLTMLFFMGISIYNLVERINEIRSGEEDDLSQY